MGDLEQGEHYVTDEDGNVLRPDDPRIAKRIRVGYTEEQKAFLENNPELVEDTRAWREKYMRSMGKDEDGNDLPEDPKEACPEGPVSAWVYSKWQLTPDHIAMAKELLRQAEFIKYQRAHYGWHGEFSCNLPDSISVNHNYYKSWDHYYGVVLGAIGDGDGSPVPMPEVDEENPHVEFLRETMKKDLEESHKEPEAKDEESAEASEALKGPFEPEAKDEES